MFQINWDFSFPWLCWVWSVVKGSLQLLVKVDFSAPVSSWYTSMSCQQSWLLCPLPLSFPAETLGLETAQKIHREQKSGAAMAVSHRSILAIDKWWKLSGGLPLFGHIPKEPRLTEAWIETTKDELPCVSIMCLLSPGRLRPSWNLFEDWVLEPCNSRHGSSWHYGFMGFLVWTFQCQLGFQYLHVPV